MRIGADRIAACLVDAGVKADVGPQALGVVCRVSPSQSLKALRALQEAGYTALVDLFATDTGRRLELTYHLRCPEDGREVYVRSRPAHDAVVRSAGEVFPSAVHAEREAAELFGLTFTGSAETGRLLTTPDLGEPPMRKSVRVGSRTRK